MLRSKDIAILRYLYNKKKNISLKEISQKFEVSERSIRYDIEKLDEEINDFKIILDYGEIKIDNYNKLYEFLLKNNAYQLSIDERENYILLKICFERIINQNNLAKQLNISKSTVKSHLKNIKEFLKLYNLKLSLLPRRGLILEGNEEQIRQALLRCMYNSQKSIFLDEIISSYLSNIEDNGIKLFINYCQKLMKKIISDEAYKIISRYLLITIYANKQNHKIDKIKNENFLKNTKEYEAIINSKAILESSYDLILNDFEYLKITDYFLGAHTYNISYSYYENWVEIEILVKKIINKVNNKIDVDISFDNTLFMGLLNHIKPTIYRLKNSIYLENTIYEEVISSYPDLFLLIKKSFLELEKFIDIKFSNDELAFLTIHFKAAIDRNQRKKKKKKEKVLIVCGSGYGSSKLLAQKLYELYKIEIVNTIPKYLLEKEIKNKEIDLIISTVDIDEKLDLDIIKVSTLLTQKDIEKLDSYPLARDNKKIIFSELIEIIEKNMNKKVNNNLVLELKDFLGNKLVDDIFQKEITNSDLINKDRIILNGSSSTWQEAIVEAGQLLLKDNIILPSYIDDMKKVVDNYGSYIMLAENSIFPHAKTKNNVKKSGFSIVFYDKPIKFIDNKIIDIVVAFASYDEKEHLDLLVKIVNKLDDIDIRKRLKNMKNKEKLIKDLLD